MRLIIPDEIAEMLYMQRPYLIYKPGEGMVLVPDAPQEVVDSRKKTMKWFKDHSEK